MTQIKPTHVTFEQAKKLKEKKMPRKFWIEDYYRYSDEKLFTFVKAESFDDDKHLFAPEQWWVLEWLRLDFKIDVFTPKVKGEYFYDIWKDINEVGSYNERVIFSKKGYGTPQEAYSAAFDHVLNNLI